MSEMGVQTTNGAWAGGAILILVGVGFGIGSPLLVATAAVPLSYLVAMALGSDPAADIRVHRRFSSEGVAVTDGSGTVAGTATAAEFDSVAAGETAWYASPGDVITVRTTVRNVGQESILDLRIIDGVPDELPVVDDTHRACVTLDPGEQTTVQYDVELTRGDHSFADPTVRIRDHTGTKTRTWSPAVAGDREVHCSPAIDQVPLDEGTDDYAGEVPTDEGGTGIEFYSLREYEPGDPTTSIDWRRYANSRELATVEYRAERSTRIVCLVDARESQFRDSPGATPRAVDLSLEAAERTMQALIEAGHPTGFVGLHSGQLTTVSPGTDAATRRQVSKLLTATRDSGEKEVLSNWVMDGPYNRTTAQNPIQRLPATLPGEALVYLFSSFIDDEPTEIVELLRSYGYSVRVVAPDINGDAETIPTRLAALARERRLTEARAAGADVIDWHLERPLGLVLQEFGEVHG